MSQTLSSPSYSGSRRVTTTSTIPSATNYKRPSNKNNRKISTQYPPGCCNYTSRRCGQFNGSSWPYKPCYDPYTGQIAYTLNYDNLMPPSCCAPYMLPYHFCQPQISSTISKPTRKQKNKNKKSESDSSSSSSSSSDSDSTDSSSSSSSTSFDSKINNKSNSNSNDAKYSTTTTETSQQDTSKTLSTQTGSSSRNLSCTKKQRRRPCNISMCPPFGSNFAPIQNPCLGMYPQTTQAMEAPYTKLPPEWPPNNRTLSQAPQDEEGLNFSFKPRSDFATEVTFTIEPKKKPLWQTMMTCGFRPMITCSAPPFTLPPNFQQHNQSHSPYIRPFHGSRASASASSNANSSSSNSGTTSSSSRSGSNSHSNAGSSYASSGSVYPNS